MIVFAEGNTDIRYSASSWHRSVVRMYVSSKISYLSDMIDYPKADEMLQIQDPLHLHFAVLCTLKHQAPATQLLHLPPLLPLAWVLRL